MHIRLKKDWHWYYRGSIIELDESEAKELVRNRIAVYASSQSSMTKRDLDYALRRN